jgi:hypothetical protein
MAMSELVHKNLPYIDATKAGMGGIWFIEDKAIIWRVPFLDKVQKELVSFKNLQGTVTNLVLELAAMITGHQDCTSPRARSNRPSYGRREYMHIL